MSFLHCNSGIERRQSFGSQNFYYRECTCIFFYFYHYIRKQNMILYLISLNTHLSLCKVKANLYQQDNCHFIKTHLASLFQSQVRLSPVQLFATPWTAVLQAPLSMGFSRQEYWSGLPCCPPGDLSDQGLLNCRRILYRLSHQRSQTL